MKKKLSVYVMSITTFDECGKLDEDMMRRHFRRLVAAGASVYVGSSGTGDGFALSAEEWDRLLAIAVEELQGKVGVRAMGYEPRRLEEMLDFVKRVERAKLDAVQVFSLDLGHAVRPTAQELETYYARVIDSVGIPVVLSSYDALGFVVPVEVLERLAVKFPGFIGYCYGGRDMTHLTDVIARLGERLEVHFAGPYNALTTLGIGGNGFMGHEGNLSPMLVQRVISSFAAGDMPTLVESYRKLMGVYTLHLRYGGSAGRAMKPLLNAFGLPGGALRAPRTPISAGELEALIAATVKLEIPGLPKR